MGHDCSCSYVTQRVLVGDGVAMPCRLWSYRMRLFVVVRMDFVVLSR